VNAQALWDWINERHAIYLRRRWVAGQDYLSPAAREAVIGNGQPLRYAYTDDPILARYRFCNVFRELDRTTIWIREHWREPHRGDPSVLFAMAVARAINWPPTLEAIGYPWPWDPGRVYHIMRDRARRGEKVYTGAYVVRGDVQRRDPSAPRDNNKPYYTVYTVLNGIAQTLAWGLDPPSLCGTLLALWCWLSALPGWGGGFTAYEVVSDLRHTDLLCRAPDIMTWAHAGLGAVRGLNRVHGRPLHVRPADPVGEMRELLAVANGAGSPLASWVPRPLEMRDIEHSLCEMDKYERARLGQGLPRQLFMPAGTLPA